MTTELFELLRRWFAVPDEVYLDLAEIDSAVREMGDPVMIAALAMRKLQALHLIATPGVRTTTDVVVVIVQDLDRALIQAPTMRLRLAAETADWDAALLELETGESEEAPASADAEDPEAQRFRMLHSSCMPPSRPWSGPPTARSVLRLVDRLDCLVGGAVLDRRVGRGRPGVGALVGLLEDLAGLLLGIVAPDRLLLRRQLGPLLDPVVAHRHCVTPITVAYPSPPCPSTTSR